ncbi:MAG: flagellar biosynthesis protein FlhF [Gammaproteobacteria bacterium]|nr:flagellar biosynthesis protein FlhF [Gammaproteobacteria bacterium]
MRIKRTYAATMREALAQVKQEQGPDAVILGNKKVPGGVEILSAIDFEHQSADAYSGVPATAVSIPSVPTRVETAEPSLSSAGLDIKTVPDFLFDQINEDRKEPVLGMQQLKQVPLVKPLEDNKDGISVMPGLKKRKNLHLKKAAPVAQVKQVETSIRRKMLPVEEEAKIRLAEKQVQQENQYRQVVESSPKTSRVDSAYNHQPVIDEVKDELKNLRDLMQSQLSVLDWDRYSDLHPVRTVLLNLMTELGLGADICEMIFNQLGKMSDEPHKVWQQALGTLAKSIPISTTDILSNGGRIALVGSTGVGKTTTIAKLAARFSHTHGKHSVALITTDNFRIGAQEQLQHFARMLEIPLLTANTSEELTDRLKMLADKMLVLIDTAGMSQADVRLSEQFHELQHGSPEIKPYLVMSANTQLAALNETIKNFSKVKLAGGIVTKMDESASLGGIITAAIRHQLPLSYCGTGQRVPEDLQQAKNHRLVSRAVSLMQKFGEQVEKETMAFRYNHIINNQTV